MSIIKPIVDPVKPTSGGGVSLPPDVGIGTDNPVNTLDIVISKDSMITSRIKNEDDGTASAARLLAMNDTSKSIGIEVYGSNYTTSGARIADDAAIRTGASTGDLRIVSANPTKGIIFYTGGALDANIRIVITSAGDVGIGTTSPDGILDCTPNTIDAGSYSYPFPRVTTTQKNALTGMTVGAHVVDITLNEVWWYNGATWIKAY